MEYEFQTYRIVSESCTVSVNSVGDAKKEIFISKPRRNRIHPFSATSEIFCLFFEDFFFSPIPHIIMA